MNILVTGGTSGLGKAVVELLAKNGHHLYFSYLFFTFHCCSASNITPDTEKSSRISVCMEYFSSISTGNFRSFARLFAGGLNLCRTFRKNLKKFFSEYVPRWK